MALHGESRKADILGRKSGPIRGTREAIWDPNLGQIPKFGRKFGAQGGPGARARGPKIFLGFWSTTLVGTKIWGPECGDQKVGTKMWGPKYGDQKVGTKLWDQKVGTWPSACYKSASGLR